MIRYDLFTEIERLESLSVETSLSLEGEATLS